MKLFSCALVAFTLLAAPSFAASRSLAKHHKKHKPAHGAHHKKSSAAPTAPSPDTSAQPQTPKVTT